MFPIKEYEPSGQQADKSKNSLHDFSGNRLQGGTKESHERAQE